jgi:hypothetical protein
MTKFGGQRFSDVFLGRYVISRKLTLRGDCDDEELRVAHPKS